MLYNHTLLQLASNVPQTGGIAGFGKKADILFEIVDAKTQAENLLLLSAISIAL